MSLLTPRLRVAIVGYGTAGQASAILLARQGHEVTIFEDVLPGDLGPVGAGVGLQPIGLSVLARLGGDAFSACMSHGKRIEGILGTTHPADARWPKRPVLDLRYSDLGEHGLFGVGMHRGALWQALANEVEGPALAPNIELKAGVRIAKLSPPRAPPAGDLWETSCNEAMDALRGQQATRRLLDGAGAQHGDFDLVVAADGRASTLRPQLGIPFLERSYPFGCVWTIQPDDPAREGRDLLTQVYDGCPTMLGLLPTGRPWGSDVEHVSMFWSLPVEEHAAFVARGLGAFKEELARCDPATEAIMAPVTRMEQLVFASYTDVMMPRFAAEGAVCIGDAAHAMSPQLGQGANLALVDAWKLALAVEDSGGDVARALARYSSERRWRTWFYQANSQLLTPVFQSRSKLIGAARDALMGPLCRFGPTRQQMLTTLAGAQNNLIPWSTIPTEEFTHHMSHMA